MDFEERIEKKIDDLTEKQTEMSETLAVNTVILEHHIKRTNIAEQRIEHVEKTTNNLYAKVAAILASMLGIAYIAMKVLNL